MTENTTEITVLLEDIKRLKQELKVKEALLYQLQSPTPKSNSYRNDLAPEEISRYSRQMLISQIGVEGQNALKHSKILIVGAGGLGCPSALYLAAAGIGELTLVDNDVVELTNLHRQILHFQGDINIPKVQSAYDKLTSINQNVKVVPLHIHADSNSLQKLLSQIKYDVVLDCSDNVATRYLLNDVCVFNKIPLVSGSALQLEGQLTVYNYKGGPCYRCLFPVPPPPETVTSCGDGGVLGVVPGTIGVLQALEAIKIVTGLAGVLSSRLLIFDGSDTTFRNVKLRNANAYCAVCGDNPTITSLINYEQFCLAKAHDKVENISILEEAEDEELIKDTFPTNHLLIDVRPELEYKMCHIDNSLNIPYTHILKNKNMEVLREEITKKTCVNSNRKVLVLCRRGNDSQRAVQLLKKKFVDLSVQFVNLKGGLHEYSRVIDPSFPVY